MKLHKPSLHIKFPKFISKTVLLVTLVIVLVLSVFAYGAVRKVQSDKVQAQKDHDTALQQKADKAELVSLRKQVKDQQNQLTFANAKAGSTCDWVRSQQPKYRYVVPQLCKV